MKDADTVLDIVTLKKNQNRISLDRFTPLILLMLAACGGGGGGGLGKPRVKISDDGSDVAISIWENTTLVSSDSEETNRELLEKHAREIASLAGKSPGRANISDINIAPDGKSVTLRLDYSNSEFSYLSATVKIELVGNDAEFFRMIRLDGLGSEIRFIDTPNYEEPSDKDANNIYNFKLKYTMTFVETGKSEVSYVNYAVTVSDVIGDLDSTDGGVIRAFDVAENTSWILTNNIMTLKNVSRIQKITFENLVIAEDGNSATFRTTDKATGAEGIVTIRLTGKDADKIEIVRFGTADTYFGLQFRTAPDYENPTDSDGNKTYEFSLVYTGLKQPETTRFRITITDLDEPASSQSRSHQNMEIFHPDTDDYNMPESQDLSPPSEFI
ncbi:hypothetical protein [Candidatus Puniceispirillum marinum]|uniref:hypothetical protein n=1 Tax=Candidatus Puniceispirillum marinum TaxID=767892 RepID=UPI0011D0FDA4|nr:hypothetical protein [Candidatus Puniceispirillum marinum]